MSDDLSHLKALNTRLSHERGYLASAKTEKDRVFRRHQIESVTKEISGEIAFLKKRNIAVPQDLEPVDDMDDDELLAELGIAPKKSAIKWT